MRRLDMERDCIGVSGKRIEVLILILRFLLIRDFNTSSFESKLR